MTSVVFDDTGLATTPGLVRVFYFHSESKEFCGWSDEYIHEGVSIPGNSTLIDPGEEVFGKVALFEKDSWVNYDDHRGDIVYSTVDGTQMVVDYVGEIRKEHTLVSPSTPYDKWNGSKWVTDVNAKRDAEVIHATNHQKFLLDEANTKTSDWKIELTLGIISDDDKTKLIEWMKYIKTVKNIDVSSAPDIDWPQPPKD